MGIGAGIIIIVTGLALLGAFISYRAGLHSIQVARRQASWPERRRLMSAGWRYFGLVFLLTALIIAGPVYVYNHPEIIQFMVTRPEPTGTNTLFLTFTNTPASTVTPASTETPAPTDTPIPSDTPAGTFTPTRVPTRTPIPTDTLWPTLTPSDTPTKTLIPSATKVMTATGTTILSITATLRPSITPLPTDTHWPTQTPSPTRTVTP